MGQAMKMLGLEQLSKEQRIDLALELWDSIEPAQPLTKITAEQQEELLRRDAELEANPELGQDWSTIRSAIERKQ